MLLRQAVPPQARRSWALMAHRPSRSITNGTNGPRWAAALSTSSAQAHPGGVALWDRPQAKPFLMSRPSSVNLVRGFADELPEHTKVALPALSPTMEMGTIVSWEKKVGDAVGEGDLLCEIETDKATMGFETPEEGYLAKIFLEGGAKDIPIGRLLCIIVPNEEDVAKFQDFQDDGSLVSGQGNSNQETQPSSSPASEVKASSGESSRPAMSTPPPPAPTAGGPGRSGPSGGGSRAFASPAAKRVAAEKGIDLSQIAKGSGMDGMITTKDLEGVSASAGLAQPPVGSSIGGMPSPMGDFSDAELSSMRKTIAKRLQQSKLEIPHYYLTVECTMDALMKLRSDINKQYEAEEIKLSVNDFLIKAVALASKRVPQCNSAWMDTAIREYHSCDVSVAVDTGSGLITPIIPAAETKGLSEISMLVKELAGKAKAGKLQPHEFQGGTITISNLGMFGIEHFTAIINPPQACILAVGGTTKKVFPDGQGGYVTKNVMKVTLSCDHRVVDGAVGAQWLKHFKKFLEQPSSMLL
ncbi:hypothetical protein TCAL_04913 [Tigriopus californicus]|uniref:Acetyltransferase component of pyruvate dehydrogenase complex n=1 Tax=Tigriopus californicus TaxID=6832 RepID=A0A553NFK3_TIGCA|nr:dihydrolipoyllysine-residue acetyltransferase component of pyruvate dehydrogenase complex, mitochondrial-like [Tigriopus californicus]TRY64149.1 hypothetical protein TCAL_04913 [Tigriopus californicus]|eukprot:TCALIF_04913-PA protein Name:"Similar to F23B12.5 Dihydrolipoyllysine-residue acetyltransferase component of pyruvate dehydrogenase complex, mitochondrial (Caenorhabditis elegans)" AED:0.00 eAED:0.00 QI:236/1/1/1/1/1/2/140/525